jgi:Zn finger protein HypA/HybF involved in hydrogenase expression
MATCEKCKKEFTPSKGLKRFCSISCRSSRVITEKQKNLQRKKMKTLMKKIKQDPQQFLEYRRRSIPKTPASKKLNMEDFDSYKYDAKRKLIIESQDAKCGRCNISEWMGEPIPLEIDHINGNGEDHSRSNMIALCPNCHSVTPTWRGRAKHSCNRVSDAQAISAIKTEPSIRQALIKCGLSPKGGNYTRFQKLAMAL